MSINKIFLPEVDKLKVYLQTHGSDRFYFTFIRNREAFIGPDNSMKFIDKFIKKYESSSEGFQTV